MPQKGTPKTVTITKELAPILEAGLYTPPFEIKFGENRAFEDGVLEEIELLRTGTFFAHGEKVEISREHLASFVKNFDEKVRGIDLAIDYSHDNEGKAAGWIKEVFLHGPTQEILKARIKWTDKGRQMLAEKEFRYVSAEFHLNYRDNETLKTYGPTLLGAGLTNRPVVKHMQPVVQLSENNGQRMQVLLAKLDDLQKELDGVKMDLQTEENEDLKPEVTEMPTELETKLEKELAAEKAKTAELSQKVGDYEAKEKKFAEEKAAEAKKAEFDALLKSNKAVEAQREAFLAGDLKKFAELAQEPKTVRLSEDAKDDGDADEKLSENAVAAEVIKLSEALVKDGKAKNIGEAVSAVLRDPAHKALSEAYSAGKTKL